MELGRAAQKPMGALMRVAVRKQGRHGDLRGGIGAGTRLIATNGLAGIFASLSPIRGMAIQKNMAQKMTLVECSSCSHILKTLRQSQAIKHWRLQKQAINKCKKYFQAIKQSRIKQSRNGDATD